MQATAIDRALWQMGENPRPIDWTLVKRILRRQNSPHTLQTSLERLVEEPALPMELLEYAVQRIAGESPHVFQRCIRNVWRRVLVDRHTIAFHAFGAGGFIDNEFLTATIEYETELLEIQNQQDLQNKTIFHNALHKTRLLLRAMQQFTSAANEPFVHAVARHGLSPFLVWLAFKDDPSVLLQANSEGLLPLHIASDAEKLCRAHSEIHRICFSSGSRENNPHSPQDQHLLNLFNRESLVPLLCHLCPQAGTRASFRLLDDPPTASILVYRLGTTWATTRLPTRGYTPLEYFLYSLQHMAEAPVWIANWATRGPRILQILRQVLKVAPLALETRHPQTRMWPFLVPMAHWESFEANSTGNNNNRYRDSGIVVLDSDTSAGQKFLLTLSYELLRANPIVLSRCYNAHQVEIRPCSKYEGLLKERLANEEQRITQLKRTKEQLLRQRDKLQEANQTLLQENQALRQQFEMAHEAAATTPGANATKSPSRRSKRRREG